MPPLLTRTKVQTVAGVFVKLYVLMWREVSYTVHQRKLLAALTSDCETSNSLHCLCLPGNEHSTESN